MYNLITKYCFLCSFLISCFFVNAQIVTKKNKELSIKQNIEPELREGNLDFLLPLENQIPKLDSLIVIGINNHPRIKFQEENYASTSAQVEFAKREWTTNIVGSINYFEGADNQQVTTFDNINTSNSLSNGFRYGATVNVPLYFFYGRKKRIELFEHANKAESWKIQEVQQQVSREIVRWYSQMIHFQKLMIIEADALEIAKVNFENAEQEFNRGLMELDEYSRISSLLRKAQVDFEFARSEFYNNYKQFELLIGEKLTNLAFFKR